MSTSSGGKAADRIPQLQARAAQLREHSLRATSEAGSGHPTSCLSSADLVAALFFDVLRYDPTDPGNPNCDRFVLSKGHAAPVLYAAWAEAGAFPIEKLLTLRRIDSELEGHPTPHFAGTVAATGSLGQGLSVGVGLAWNAKQLSHNDQRIYVLCGDGEVAEGSVWEAIALAAHQQLDNLVTIVDVNGLGQSQRTMYGFDVAGYAARFAAFGWHAIPIDGHDMEAIVAAFEEAAATRGRPVAIIARTKKGQGVAALADKDNWHGKPVPKGADLENAVAEVRAAAPQVALAPVAKRGGARAAAEQVNFPGCWRRSRFPRRTGGCIRIRVTRGWTRNWRRRSTGTARPRETRPGRARPRLFRWRPIRWRWGLANLPPVRRFPGDSRRRIFRACLRRCSVSASRCAGRRAAGPDRVGASRSQPIPGSISHTGSTAPTCGARRRRMAATRRPVRSSAGAGARRGCAKAFTRRASIPRACRCWRNIACMAGS